MCSDINSIYCALLRHLQNDDKSLKVANDFTALKTNSERVSFVYSILDGYSLLPNILNDTKNDEKADEFRQKGNLFYKDKKIGDAIEMYTKSLAYASNEGEKLSLAYGNRSAALFELGFFKECLQDIQRALENNYPEHLKQKLLIRKINAEKQESNQVPQHYYQKVPIILDEVKNLLIQCATNSVEILFTEDLGRYVVAKKPVEIGEIIAVEKSFCSILIEDFTIHCYECLHLCYNLLPCSGCTQALFCSEACRENAQKYHKYDCNILKTLRKLKVDKMKMIALKIAVIIKDEYENLQTDSSLTPGETYCSNRYKEIHNLVGNTNQRTVPDLLKRATLAAILFHLVKAFTSFFNDEHEESVFKEMLLLHMQTSPCNFHEISEIAEGNGIFKSKEIGVGAFSFLSMFNHSCTPNVVRHCYGSTVVLRAIRTIPTGQQCLDNYGYHHAITPKSERQTEIKEQYFFDCMCEACLSDWPLHQNLPIIETTIAVTSAQLTKLVEGNVKCAEEVLVQFLPQMKELENKGVPNKNFAEMQEIIKQCFALLGNRKEPIK